MNERMNEVIQECECVCVFIHFHLPLCVPKVGDEERQSSESPHADWDQLTCLCVCVRMSSPPERALTLHAGLDGHLRLSDGSATATEDSASEEGKEQKHCREDIKNHLTQQTEWMSWADFLVCS